MCGTRGECLLCFRALAGGSCGCCVTDRTFYVLLCFVLPKSVDGATDTHSLAEQIYAFWKFVLLKDGALPSPTEKVIQLRLQLLLPMLVKFDEDETAGQSVVAILGIMERIITEWQATNSGWNSNLLTRYILWQLLRRLKMHTRGPPRRKCGWGKIPTEGFYMCSGCLRLGYIALG